ncbi:hypothetical protein CCACVL1_07744 [Corchorus capsularis]|uniref:Uncharacterized protein n=1 Tax=Corchorus capsularis TaxID=210143 RepID=A0A1R3J438_COCAP|nr:hypothetical protein CCACVL1_07744 [Corchorus capsularis]
MAWQSMASGGKTKERRGRDGESRPFVLG